MRTDTYKLEVVSLNDVVQAVKPALVANYSHVAIEVTQCPDLRLPPFSLAGQGLNGEPVIADIGGQANLFPEPILDRKYSMIDVARDCMHMSPTQGMLIGAGAGPFHVIGQNSELAPNLAWKDGFENVQNYTHFVRIEKSGPNAGMAVCEKCPSTECALMMNLFGCSGLPGPVIKIKARKRVGSTESFTDVIRFALYEHFGDKKPVSLGGVFLIRKGRANFHIMPDFPSPDTMPFRNREQVNDWLTYHNFSVNGQNGNDEIVCLTVLHSADPNQEIGLRMEHTHCFSADGRGGHYHYDLDEAEIEYEGYFNIAEVIYRVDRPT